MITRWRHHAPATRRRISHLSEALASLARTKPEPSENLQSVRATVPSIASLLSSRYIPETDETVIINGFVRSVRKHAKVAFAALQDGSAVPPLQVVMEPALAEK